MAPTIAVHRSMMKSFSGKSPPVKHSSPMHKKVSSDVPPASPSRPSERLMALVTPTITTSVTGSASTSGKLIPSGRQLPR